MPDPAGGAVKVPAFGDVTRFSTVDEQPDPGPFVGFLDLVNALPEIQAVKKRMITRLGLGPGQRVLDVGCGTGDDVRRLAGLVAPSGRAVGVDLSLAMVNEARSRAAGSDLPVEFHQGDITHLDFPDATFDAARGERVLLHAPDAAAAVAEMARVTRPGGRLVVFDLDMGTVALDHPDLVTTRRIMSALSDKVSNGCIGRQLPRLFRQAGLGDVEVEPATVIMPPLPVMTGLLSVMLADSPDIIDPADLAAWLAPLQEAEQAGHVFACAGGFIVSGTR
jgi:ubiquinone/menaquinone biosynthesis C-methylase UbiE